MIEIEYMTDPSSRTCLNFAKEVRKAFAFLGELGFFEIEALPTLVRYQKDSIEVDVYHGRQSYEIGASVTAFGSRYEISEIIRHIAPEVEKYVRYSATTSEGVVAGLSDLGLLMKRYGRLALDGDPDLFLALERERKSWSAEYALDVLADQLRPLASEAFRRKDYTTSAKLYARIRERLSETEIKKLSIAEKLSKR